MLAARALHADAARSSKGRLSHGHRSRASIFAPPARSDRHRRPVVAAAAFGLVWLVLILGVLLYNGVGGLSLRLSSPRRRRRRAAAGGLLNAIVGSLMMTVLAVASARRSASLAGTYLAEYGRHDKFAVVVRFVNDILLCAPSIVIGLFIYEIMVAPMGHFSGWAGARVAGA